MSQGKKAVPSFQETSIVMICAGESQVAFHVHKDHLYHVSPVLKSAFLGGFKESAEQTFSLPDYDVDTCERFIHWLYTKSCLLSGDEERPSGAFQALARLYVLATYLQIEDLLKDVINTIYGMDPLDISGNAIEYIYEHTAENSLLRKVVVNYHTGPFDLDWLKGESAAALMHKIPQFTFNLAIDFSRRLQHHENRYVIKPKDRTKTG